MNKVVQTRILKISFWIGAITDALAAIIMIFPRWGGFIFGHDNIKLTPAYRYALGMGAALMVGWKVLLVWGSLKPPTLPHESSRVVYYIIKFVSHTKGFVRQPR